MNITAIDFARLFKHTFCVIEETSEIEHKLIQDMNLPTVFVVTEKTDFKPYLDSFHRNCRVVNLSHNVPPAETTTISIAVGTIGNGDEHLLITVNAKSFAYNDSSNIICSCCQCDVVIPVNSHAD